MKKLKTAVVGLNFGKHIIDNMILNGPAEPYFELVAVCADDVERCDALAEQYGVAGYYCLSELLKDESLAVVVVMTGPVGRAELIRQIIRAGKDVMTTKPFEQNAAAAASVLAEARELGRLVYMNSPSAVMNKDFQTIRAWENKYNLGRLVAGHHECWYKSVEEADGSWYDNAELCPAAPILRLGIYGINDLTQFFGEPEEVQVMESRIFTGRPTSDIARLCIKFKSGAIVDTLDGWVCQPARGAQSLTLYYENGTIMRNPVMTPIKYEAVDGTFLCVITKDSEESMPEETLQLKGSELSSYYAWEDFYKAIVSGERPEHETPDEVVVNGIKILEAVKTASLGNGIAKV